MIVHGYFRSSAAHRLRIALNLKGLAYDFRSIHLRKGEQRSVTYRAVNPQGLVPAIEAEDGAVLTQSLAIIEWLEEPWPAPALLPPTPVARAQVRAFAQIIACDIHPLQNLRVLRYLSSEYGQEQDGLDTWCRHWLGEGLAACEALLARAPQTPFAFSGTPGLADICLVPQLSSADRFGLDLAPFPHLRRVRASCEALPAFADAHPWRQPDSEP